MKNINVVKVVKVVSLLAGVVSTLGTAWVTTKENEATLSKLVEEKLKNSK